MHRTVKVYHGTCVLSGVLVSCVFHRLSVNLCVGCCFFFFFYMFFFQAEDGIRDLVRSRGLGDVYKRQGGCKVPMAGSK